MFFSALYKEFLFILNVRIFLLKKSFPVKTKEKIEVLAAMNEEIFSHSLPE